MYSRTLMECWRVFDIPNTSKHVLWQFYLSFWNRTENDPGLPDSIVCVWFLLAQYISILWPHHSTTKDTWIFKAAGLPKAAKADVTPVTNLWRRRESGGTISINWQLMKIQRHIQSHSHPNIDVSFGETMSSHSLKEMAISNRPLEICNVYSSDVPNFKSVNAAFRCVYLYWHDTTSSFVFWLLAKKPNLILSTFVSHLALLRHGGVVSPDIHLANQAL